MVQITLIFFAPPSRAIPVSQVELNAKQQLRTIEKLQKDEEAVDRKTQHLAMTSECCQIANDAKAARVAEHNRQFKALQKARRQLLLKASSAREAYVCEQRASNRECLDSAGAELTRALNRSANIRDRMLGDRQNMILQHIEEDQEKLRRKAQSLDSVRESRYIANTQKTKRVHRHNLQLEKQLEARRCQLRQATDARAERIRQEKEDERKGLAYMGARRDACIHNAVRARECRLQAQAARITEKQQHDEAKLQRKQENLASETMRLAHQSQVREGRLQMVKRYEELVASMRRST